MLSTGQHTLTTQADPNESHKHCMVVKLTDSSVKAIEEYLRNKNNINKKPSICFKKNEGEINFPMDGTNSKKLFFTLSNVKETNKSGSFECISFNNSKLMTIGNIEEKVTIKANVEETFKDTKDKLSIIAEEEKKNSLIELKSSVNPNRPKSSNPVVTTTRTTTTTILPEQVRPKIDRPLRERVIHLLAYKPYQKAAILVRLNKISDKEKEMLDSIVQSVATLNQKTLIYELNNDIMINEVNEDWPFYNEQERMVVKRNISNLKKSLQSTTSLNNTLSSSSLNTSANESISAFQPTSNNRNYQRVNPNLSSQSKTKPPPIKQIKTNNTSITSSHKFDLGSPDSPDSDDLLNDSDLSINNKKTAIEKENHQVSKKMKLFDNNNANQSNENIDNQELIKKYPKIQSSKQLEQYKNEFDQIYNEYLEAHNYLESVATLFQTHKKELDAINDKNSKEYEEKKNNVYKEYMQKLNDANYIKTKEKHDKLSNKLNFIQDLIKQYQSFNS